MERVLLRRCEEDGGDEVVLVFQLLFNQLEDELDPATFTIVRSLKQS